MSENKIMDNPVYSNLETKFEAGCFVCTEGNYQNFALSQEDCEYQISEGAPLIWSSQIQNGDPC